MKTISQPILILLFLLLYTQLNAQVLYRGINAGQYPSTGTYYGNSAGRFTTGHNNVFIGLYAGYENESGADNTFIGSYAGDCKPLGSGNTFIGYAAGGYLYEGSNNVFIGREAGQVLNEGNNNVFIGNNAGLYGWDVSYSVFIGNEAGRNAQGSNKLYIANSSTSTPLIYGEFDNNLLTVHGKLGIGTKNPARILEVFDATNPRIRVNNTNKADIHAYLELYRNDNDAGVIGHFFGGGDAAGLRLGTTRSDGNIIFLTSTNIDATTNERMRITSNGKVGIGTNTPEYKLDVYGTIRAREVKIDLDGTPVPDFVFREGYQLMGLKELEQFVRQNHHLPDIPSEKELLENGINMKEFQMILLQKIEELTLYTIQQEERIKALEASLNKQSLNANHSVDMNQE